jgi:RNA recognition motif-containing protein
MATTKVFVGNLVFSTTGDELKNAFSAHANVLSANIITRGRRSLGYGFVEFASEADAEKAVAAMNKAEISGRPINVEVARPRDPAKEAEVREKKAARVAKPRQPRQAKEGGDAAATTTTGGSPSANGRRGGRRGGRSNGASPSDGAASSTSAAPAATGGANAAAASGAAPRGRGRGTRRPAQPRRPRTEAEARPASDTTLFVANVPFSTTDEQLLALFAEHKPKSAHVVRMRNGRSRGYGFVEFDNAAGQKAGLAVDGKEVPLPNGSNLKLSVKIAMTPPPVQSPSDSSAAPSDAPASETPQ